ncbi:MAG: hypothetical protein NTZ48_05905, partial [Candidatus Omnitrophica bacterium]|nr:hypothetical protein [Candidatus Omnitrophota bacterium]
MKIFPIFIAGRSLIGLAALAFSSISLFLCFPVGLSAQEPEGFDTRIEFIGILLNGVDSSRTIDPEFASQDFKDEEVKVREIFGKQWPLLKEGQSYSATEVTEGSIIYAGLVISRAEITKTSYQELGLIRYTAWLTMSLEFFNVQTRAIYYSVMRTTYSLYTDSIGTSAPAASNLLNPMIQEVAGHLTEKAHSAFDPDLIRAQLEKNSNKGMMQIKLTASSQIGPGHNFFTTQKLCEVDKETTENCRLNVIRIENNIAIMQLPPGITLPPGTKVWTIANKKDPPGVQAFKVASLKLDTSASQLTGDEQFLMLQLHDRLSEKGNVRMVSPIETVWNERALKRFKSKGVVSTSSVELRMEEIRPSFFINAMIFDL